MSSYLITGCSRGLGLELIRQLSILPVTQVSTVIATARSKSASPALKSIIESAPRPVHFIQLDQASTDSINSAVATTQSILGTSGLDVLINSAATQYPDPTGAPGMQHLSSTLNTNVIGVHNVTAAFLRLLRQGAAKKIIFISSTLGLLTSASDFTFAPVASYKISKAALNMLCVQYALDLDKEGFTCVSVSPGNMKTEIGGGDGADLSVEVGARATLDVILRVGREDNGKFKNIKIEGSEVYNGTHAGW